MNTTFTRKSWDTSVKHYVRLGLYDNLPQNIKFSISKTNIHRWKNEPLDKYLGCEITKFIHEEIEFYSKINDSLNAKRVIKAYFKLTGTFHQLVGNTKAFNKKLKNNKEQIVEIIEQIKNDLPIEQALSFFNISRSTYQSYKNIVLNKCSGSYFEWCVKTYPNQLLKKEVVQIKKYFEDNTYKHWSKISIYYLGLRNKDFACCKATFYKYVTLLGYSGVRHHAPKIKYTSLVTSKPNQVWCADVTKYKLPDGSLWSIHLLMDHFSRKVLGFKVDKTPQATSIFELIKKALIETKEPPEYFMTDGGSENCNEVVKTVTKQQNIKHLIAQKDIRFSNSGIEALNKILKHQFLHHMAIITPAHLEKATVETIEIYNTIRPHGALQGYTPNEAYDNSKDFEWFTIAIEKQKAIRIEQNKANSCRKCLV